MLKRLLLWLVLISVGLLGASAYWVYRPLPLTAETVDLSIEPNTSVRGIAKAAVQAGVEVSPDVLFLFFRLSGQSRFLRAGSYEISNGANALDVLRKLTRGEESLRAVSLIDGWTFRQFRAALNKAEGLKHDSRELSDEAIMEKLGLAGIAPEGRFFPDTYTYGKGSSDLRILQRAANAMTKQLGAAWSLRAKDIQVQTIDEALILASIVEKETGRESDRTTISSVFHNRLRIGMPLQTDPTVIYGLGESFDGNLRRADLRTDHPWNTYTRKGLPPTPIAMPGKNALLAAVQPATSQALYFVARGDGTSQFSATLDEHNAAVNRYQRGIKSPNSEEAK
ncbi:MAG: hypothetical protein RI902_1895 [Pseudomonadota bacterium]